MNPNIKEEWLTSRNWFDYHGLYEWAANMPFKKYVEVGSWKGHSISFLAQIIVQAQVKTDYEIYAVDLWENSKMSDTQVPELPYIHEIFTENLTRAGVREHVKDLKMSSVEASKLFKDKSLDFVFIDADHSYESVKEDITHWKPKLKPGCVLAGHDYYAPGVKRAVQQLISTYDLFGPCWVTKCL